MYFPPILVSVGGNSLFKRFVKLDKLIDTEENLTEQNVVKHICPFGVLISSQTHLAVEYRMLNRARSFNIIAF